MGSAFSSCTELPRESWTWYLSLCHRSSGKSANQNKLDYEMVPNYHEIPVAWSSYSTFCLLQTSGGTPPNTAPQRSREMKQPPCWTFLGEHKSLESFLEWLYLLTLQDNVPGVLMTCWSEGVTQGMSCPPLNHKETGKCNAHVGLDGEEPEVASVFMTRCLEEQEKHGVSLFHIHPCPPVAWSKQQTDSWPEKRHVGREQTVSCLRVHWILPALRRRDDIPEWVDQETLFLILLIAVIAGSSHLYPQHKLQVVWCCWILQNGDENDRITVCKGMVWYLTLIHYMTFTLPWGKVPEKECYDGSVIEQLFSL